jgi:hypothetical protein
MFKDRENDTAFAKTGHRIGDQNKTSSDSEDTAPVVYDHILSSTMQSNN